MPLNPNIILAGQQPDYVNILARGNQAAAIAGENQHRNALRQTYQQHGQGIMAGDPNSLNALAQVDPMQALGVQNTLADNRRADEQLGMRKQEFDLKLRAFAQQASQEEKARITEGIKNAMIGALPAYQSGSLEGVNQALAAVGEAPISSLDEFPSRAAMYKEVFTALKDVRDFNTPEDNRTSLQKNVDWLMERGMTQEQALKQVKGGTSVYTGDIISDAAAKSVVDLADVKPSDKFDESVQDAVGGTGLAVAAINTIGEVVRLGQAAPNIDKAQTALTNLSTTTMLGLSEDFPGRPSNLTRERIEELTIKPAELLTGPQRALNKTRNMLSIIEESVEAANAILLNPIYKQEDKAAATTALRRLSQTYADYKNLESALSANETDADIDAIADKWAQ